MKRQGGMALWVRVAVAPIALGLALAGPASPALAEDVQVDVPFTFDPQSITIEYGQYWSFLASKGIDIASLTTASGTITNAPAGYVLGVTGSSQTNAVNFTSIYAYPSATAPALGAGSYSISVSAEGIYTFEGTTTTYRGVVAAPAELTITPAALGIEARLVSDPADPTSTIFSARFTGRFVDEFSSSAYPGTPVAPSGTWTASITDADGDVVETLELDHDGGTDVLATSSLWTGAEPGEQYTLATTFTPTGDSAANFSVAPAPAFEFTGSEDVRPTPTPSATAVPDNELAPKDGLSLPVWAIALVGLGIAALVAVLVFLWLRSRRPRSDGDEPDGTPTTIDADEDGSSNER